MILSALVQLLFMVYVIGAAIVLIVLVFREQGRTRHDYTTLITCALLWPAWLLVMLVLALHGALMERGRRCG